MSDAMARLEDNEQLVREVAHMIHEWEGQEYVDHPPVVEQPDVFARRLLAYIGENLARSSSPNSSD